MLQQNYFICNISVKPIHGQLFLFKTKCNKGANTTSFEAKLVSILVVKKIDAKLQIMLISAVNLIKMFVINLIYQQS